MRTKALVITVILQLFPSGALADSIEDAYRAIPHRQTTFTPRQSQLAAARAHELDVLFSSVDQAIVQRVQTMNLLSSSSPQKVPSKNEITERLVAMDQLAQRIANEVSSPQMRSIRTEISLALAEQRQFLSAWAEAIQNNEPVSKFGDLAHSELVQRSHQRLVDSYSKLMALYPSESEHNRQAFFDHLCALDFL